MKLVRSIALLEEKLKAQALARELKGSPIGIVWTSDERNAPPGCVCDVYILPTVDEIPRWKHKVRPSRGPTDLGDVYEDGKRVGRVTRIRGSLVEFARAECAES